MRVTFHTQTVKMNPTFRVTDRRFIPAFGKVITSGVDIPYTGAMTVTPNEYTQTLQTDGKAVTGNIKVNPIPTNYGRITWDGSKITVS